MNTTPELIREPYYSIVVDSYQSRETCFKRCRRTWFFDAMLAIFSERHGQMQHSKVQLADFRQAWKDVTLRAATAAFEMQTDQYADAFHSEIAGYSILQRQADGGLLQLYDEPLAA